jgi:hypothetical protein
MAIPVRKSTEESGSRTKYTGLANLSVIGVSPSKESLEKIGMNPDKEQIYVTSETVNDKPLVTVRFNFILKLEVEDTPIYIQHSIFLKGKIRKSKEGKIEMIDKFGKSGYITQDQFKNKQMPYDWIDEKSAAPALEGQVELIQFMRNLAGCQKEDETTLAQLSPGGDFKALFKMDGSGFSEIRKDIKACNENENKIKFLLGVRTTDDGKVYQDVFSYALGRPYAKAEYFHKELKKFSESSSKYLDSRYFGKIDLNRDTPNNDDYQLKVYSEESGSSAANTPSPQINADGYPSVFDEGMVPAGAEDDPFADPFA